MKIAVSSSGTELASSVDPRFGRCRFLVFYDIDSGEWETIANDNINASGGAGIRTAQLVLDIGAAAVITGNVGPNAMGVLSGGGIPVYTGFNGTVESALQAYREGGLSAASGLTADAHAGMQGGGMGGGRGMGTGRGRGRGSW